MVRVPVGVNSLGRLHEAAERHVEALPYDSVVGMLALPLSPSQLPPLSHRPSGTADVQDYCNHHCCHNDCPAWNLRRQRKVYVHKPGFAPSATSRPLSVEAVAVFVVVAAAAAAAVAAAAAEGENSSWLGRMAAALNVLECQTGSPTSGQDNQTRAQLPQIH